MGFVGPAARRRKAISALKALRFSEASGSVPWRDAFPEYCEENLPCACLTGARVREGLRQQTLAQLTGIPQRHISEMETGKRPIGGETAKKLAAALHVGYRVFL